MIEYFSKYLNMLSNNYPEFIEKEKNDRKLKRKIKQCMMKNAQNL